MRNEDRTRNRRMIAQMDLKIKLYEQNIKSPLK